MRLPRFRIRTLMIAVAVVALSVWRGIEAIRLHRLSRYYRARATAADKAEAAIRTWQLRMETDFAANEAELRRGVRAGRVAASIVDDAMRSAREELAQAVGPKIEYHSVLKRRYEHAARYPWLLVAPDPPLPK